MRIDKVSNIRAGSVYPMPVQPVDRLDGIRPTDRDGLGVLVDVVEISRAYLEMKNSRRIPVNDDSEPEIRIPVNVSGKILKGRKL